jgi:hypothetical protein
MFVYGHEAQFYFLAGRFYPWPYSQLYPGQEGADQGFKLAYKLATVPPRLVLRGVLKWPGVPDFEDYAPRLSHYMKWHFTVDEDFFVEHPVPAGEAPPDWVIAVMEPVDWPEGEP